MAFLGRAAARPVAPKGSQSIPHEPVRSTFSEDSAMTQSSLHPGINMVEALVLRS